MTALKAQDRARIEAALDRADPAIRLFLLHGPDESASRDLARRIERSLGADAERIDLTGAQLRADPARLADEAAALALFGGRRHVRVEPAGDEIIEAVEALLSAPAAGNPVVAIAGTLRKDAKLLKRAGSDAAMLAYVSYPPEGRNADALAAEIGRAHGLRMRPEVAHRLAAACGADRAVLAREAEKLALYLDAAPEAPLELEHAALDALGADTGEADLDRLVNAVTEGRLAELETELTRLAADGMAGISVARAVQRHLLTLAEIAGEGGGEGAIARLTRGRPPKLGDALRRQAARWDGPSLAIAIARLGEAGRAAMGPAGAIAIDAELIAIGRAAARRR